MDKIQTAADLNDAIWTMADEHPTGWGKLATYDLIRSRDRAIVER